ncbi:unnamed protein product [Urochloa humidicola]
MVAELSCIKDITAPAAAECLCYRGSTKLLLQGINNAIRSSEKFE